MNRRELIGGAAAIGASASAVGGTLAIAAQATPASPDADLIALADDYAAARVAYNAYAGLDDSPEDTALWADYVRCWFGCMAAQPVTLAGLAAKARMVVLDARNQDGQEMQADQSADRMARSIVHDLLRLTEKMP